VACVHVKQQLKVVCERTEHRGLVYFGSYDFMHRHTANCDVGEPHVGKTWGGGGGGAGGVFFYVIYKH